MGHGDGNGGWTSDVRPLVEGMDLRDYFAAHATDTDIEYYLGTLTMAQVRGLESHQRVVARYLFADAMMAARQR